MHTAASSLANAVRVHQRGDQDAVGVARTELPFTRA
jgi:hypothetical protein